MRGMVGSRGDKGQAVFDLWTQQWAASSAVSKPIAALLDQVPPKGAPQVRYHGWYRNKSRGLRQRNTGAAAGKIHAPPARPRRRRVAWRELIQQVGGVDPLHCPLCSGLLRPIAVVETKAEILAVQNLLTDLLVEPGMAEFLLDRFTDFYVAYFDRMLTAARGRIDILRIADDLGTQTGLLFSPEVFATFIAPRLRRLIDMAHRHGAKVMFHSCGSIVPFIEPLIELGVDILDPLQVTASNMEPQMLKDRFQTAPARTCASSAGGRGTRRSRAS
jgi:hypothetical protein